jgi:hypothetical protein
MNITADSKGILTAGVRKGSSGSYRPPLGRQIPNFFAKSEEASRHRGVETVDAKDFLTLNSCYRTS